MSEQMPIANVVIVGGEVRFARLYAPGLPDGGHDLFCAPCDPRGGWAPSMFAKGEMTDRERFEAWWNAPNGPLPSSETECAWWVWQAAAEIERLRADYRLAEAEIRECTLMGVESRLRVRAFEAEVEALRPDAERWRWWRQHWRALTTMACATEAGIDLRQRGVHSPDDMDEVTDAAMRGKDAGSPR
jgi:hypothetical protein